MTKKKRLFEGSKQTLDKLKKKQADKVTRPQKSPSHQPILQAMVWYKEENYNDLKAIFDDGHLLPLTYEDWHIRAQEKKKEIESQGDQVIKVFIDPETFPQWCESRKCKKDAEARSQLAIEVAQAQSFSL